MENEPDQDALFEVEGPDEDGCVWICSAKPPGTSSMLLRIGAGACSTLV
jgi:hypothetical protein